jgi:hypothetical protein
MNQSPIPSSLQIAPYHPDTHWTHSCRTTSAAGSWYHLPLLLQPRGACPRRRAIHRFKISSTASHQLVTISMHQKINHTCARNGKRHGQKETTYGWRLNSTFPTLATRLSFTASCSLGASPAIALSAARGGKGEAAEGGREGLRGRVGGGGGSRGGGALVPLVGREVRHGRRRLYHRTPGRGFGGEGGTGKLPISKRRAA